MPYSLVWFSLWKQPGYEVPLQTIVIC